MKINRYLKFTIKIVEYIENIFDFPRCREVSIYIITCA